MAVPKKGSRRIVVDGVAYLWRFPRPTRAQGDGWRGVRVMVCREECRQSVLVLAFPARFHLSGPVVQEPPRPLLPSDVARGIRAALAAGWQADRPGPQFVHRVAEEI